MRKLVSRRIIPVQRPASQTAVCHSAALAEVRPSRSCSALNADRRSWEAGGRSALSASSTARRTASGLDTPQVSASCVTTWTVASSSSTAKLLPLPFMVESIHAKLRQGNRGLNRRSQIRRAAGHPAHRSNSISSGQAFLTAVRISIDCFITSGRLPFHSVVPRASWSLR